MATTRDALTVEQGPQRQGLRVRRRWTSPGAHPYDAIAWERRDAVIHNWRTGAIAFEQRDVDFPASWSQNATNIVAQKYFRGQLGTPQREHSVRQMIDRVTGHITAWGREGGYFAGDDDADAFHAELTHLLVNQWAAFNSPVWFNVGVETDPQCSACFILAVEDTMPSILNWYVEEGMIFKGGSGSGINLSTIRSSKEQMATGGEASGPVSFMRGADASAGTIKSGGKTRRAAKMVILNVDHPDVRDFIWCKAREEHKARALRDAGFDMDLDGADSYSIQYQNANNSVRVTDEFMAAYESGEDFGFKAVSDGSVVESVPASELMREIAQAAWECADPGMQYDTTINDWHTTPESGRINGSNPCFPGDALVHTDKGLVAFRELFDRANQGETFAVWTHDATNPDAPAERMELTRPEAFMITGYNDVVRLRFGNGMELRCTPGHKIFTTNRGYVEARDLTFEDEVKTLNLPAPAVSADLALPVTTELAAYVRPGEVAPPLELPEKWSCELAYALGRLVGGRGDAIAGSVGSRDEHLAALLEHHKALTSQTGTDELTGLSSVQDNASAEHVGGVLERFFEALGLPPAGAHAGVFSANGAGAIPWSIYQAPPEMVAAFLEGLFAAQAPMLQSDERTDLRLVSSSRGLLVGAQRLLATLGVGCDVGVGCDAASGADGVAAVGQAGPVLQWQGADDGAAGAPRARYELRVSASSLPAFAVAGGVAATSAGDALVAPRAEVRDGVRGSGVTPVSTRLVERIEDGYELTYNLSEPRNHSYVVNGVVVRNCSEYMHLDNSACNLASINLLRFLKPDGVFDVEAFRHAVEIVFLAQEIIVGNSSYPTQRIGRNAHDYRQLGIGYANLGALLMAIGKAYDSDEGRAWAGAITALMTGQAYRTSARVAEVAGPFAGYAANREPMLRVMRKHRAAVDTIDVEAVQGDLLEAARSAWDEAITFGEEHGYRNAQASVLAPTGTIGLLMDCDTTGIEPDLALVKTKKLVGGGSMSIVNQTVPRALRMLGYAEEHVQAILEHIAEHNSVHGAPALRPEHYSVFDCAMGSATIHYMGHVRMMAAVQPFLSGAISKTVNLPESASVEDVERVYVEGWRLGLKAIALYRDNCKVGQPLSATKSSTPPSAGAAASTAGASGPGGSTSVAVEDAPVRHRLPKTRPSLTTSFRVGDIEGYLTAGSFPDDGLGEIFIKVSKQGSTLSGVMDAFAIAVSLGLQYGVPLEAFVSKFTNMIFEPNGLTDDQDVRIAQSLVDYLFRRLAIDHLDVATRQALGIRTTAERSEALRSTGEDRGDGTRASDAGEPARASASLAESSNSKPSSDTREQGLALSPVAVDAPFCATCGVRMRPAGSCFVCESCGTTSGCS